MTTKTSVLILCGGQSPEHEVSLMSAKNVVAAIDRTRHDVIVIGIDKQGQWMLLETDDFLFNRDDPSAVSLKKGPRVRLVPGERRDHLLQLDSGASVGHVDVVFPVMHGGSAEDGSLQGLLRMLDLPFVGASVLGSAVGMDKDVMKRLLRDAGLPLGKFIVMTDPNRAPSFEELSEALGNPVFVKPANTGSSVGISKARDAGSFTAAVAEAFRFDTKVLVEEFIEGREIECAVLGNRHPRASVAGEIKPTHDFYSYEAKYLDPNGAALVIPADLEDPGLSEMQTLAVLAYQTLCCEGLARVDFFLRADGRFFINEINTIPGFTKISMYPKLWNCSGLGYSELIEELLRLAMSRFETQKALETSFSPA